jgi:lysophospholipid acyltransferase (LPLAT)-like uncharacterized protein
VNPKRKVQRHSGVVVPHSPKWHQRLAAWLIAMTIRIVSATLRTSWKDDSGDLSTPVIYCIWHNRLALCMKSYFHHARQKEKPIRMAALISASKDGALLAAILEQFGVQPARGSSSRRGTMAVLEMARWARNGYDLAITPDGPRGPCYVAQEGVILLAQVTGLPIVPSSYSACWKFRFKSWDRFLVPLPFSRCEICYGRPIHVPREATPEDRERFRQQLEAELSAITHD